jgi:hypothetical protein
MSAPGRSTCAPRRCAKPSRAASFTADGVTVCIAATPDIRPAFRDEDRYCVPVRIRYLANISAT